MNKSIKILLSQAIASQLLCNYSPYKCNDQIWGSIDCRTKPFRIFKKCHDIDGIFQEKAAIIIILESPHIQEYDSSTKQALGPCMGKSGENINTFLPEIISSESIKQNITTQKYDIVLINAVQYQCSLGTDTLLYRDAMFLLYWEQEFYRNDFCDRLKEVVNSYPEHIIINCCTTGFHSDFLTNHSGFIDMAYYQELGVSIPLIQRYKNSDYSLRNCVSTMIDRILSPTDHFYTLSHPSVWDNSETSLLPKRFFRGKKRI